MDSSKSRRRRRVDSDNESDDAGAQTPEPLKRPRRSTVLPQDQHDQIHSGPSHTNGGSQLVNMELFQPGSIVRVTVQNFVTYERAEFFPGPYLNMVIGPNGTGKSSLVCAICLGLGYSPKHLGRAGSIKEFVKHGKEKATIEIELQKKPTDRHNYVIRVQIRRDQNSQKWWLNGKETTHKNIQDLMKALKIQVDNLCQFLPQDRVVEFAASTPVELLRETLRAAAPEEMLLWQSKLRELYREKKELTENSRNDAETLQNLEARQQGLQADVDRLYEREEIQKRLNDLEIVRVLAKYQETRDRYTLAREKKKRAQESLRRLETESGPSLEAVNRKQGYLDKINAALTAKSRALDQCHELSDALNQKVKDEQSAIDEFDTRYNLERKQFDAKKKELAASRSKITSLQADLKNRPGEFTAAEWNQKIRAEEHNLRELESSERELTAEMSGLREKGKVPRERKESLAASLKSLDTQEGKQLNLMSRLFPDVSRAWDWIQEHKDEFEKEVFGPPMISCSIKDERYSSQVQAFLQNDDFTCFIAQTTDDLKKLTKQFYREMGLSVVIRKCSNPLSMYRSPLSQAEASDFGLDGFAIDFIQGPEPVLAMLCAEKRLHMSAVTLQDHSNEQYNRLVNSVHVSQWAAGRQMYTIRRRKEYGDKAMSALTKFIQPGRYWNSQLVDSQEKMALERQLLEAEAEFQVLKEQNNVAAAKRKGIVEEKAEIQTKIAELKAEKNALQREHQKWQSLPERIESEERRMEESKQLMEAIRNRIYADQYELDKLVMAKFNATMRHAASLEDMRIAHQEYIEAKIRFVEAGSDVNGLKARSAHIMQQVEAERATVEETTREADTARRTGREISDMAKNLLVQHQDRRDYLQSLANGKTEHDIVLEIDAEKAQLELIHAANPNILREFEKRAQEISKLQRKMDSVNTKVAELDTSTTSLMNRWEPKLDELISQINSAFAYNFEQISCSGEVRVHKDDNFDQWSLNIMVRFRESETLQQLTAHRQSGGERAVSTIFFLMALQSLAQSPFRVVDEINQGMDPRNERMVHERMVEIACREHTSQYFLITPKLLPGLRYDSKMRVLCIASGEFMPKDGGKLNFHRCLATVREMAAARAARA